MSFRLRGTQSSSTKIECASWSDCTFPAGETTRRMTVQHLPSSTATAFPHTMSTSEEIELLVLGDIKDVFGTWNDSESSADEVEDGDSTSPPSDLTVPPLRSQTRLSKRTLAQAVSSLPPASGPPAKRRKGALSSTFSPFSSEDYLHRLGSFNLLNFSSSAFPPSAAARAGWSSSGRDRLKCGCCQAAWKISVFTGLKGPVRDKLADRMKEMLRSDHRETCPWRKFGLDIVGREDLSPIPEVKGLSVVEVRTRADAMATHLPEGLQLDHPLVRFLLPRSLLLSRLSY